MTDQVPSGDSAATNETPAAQPDAGSFGTFGAKRGSGLARGKRASTPAASAAASAPAGTYQPTALELITPQREYQNPFGGDNTVAAPAAAEAPVPPIESPAPALPAPTAAPEPIPAQREYVTEQVAEAPVAPAPQIAVEESAPVKAELNILPPAETKRAATSWESRDDRPVFRTDAHRARESRGESRDVREGGEQPRRERREHSQGGSEGPRSFSGPRSSDAPRSAEGHRSDGRRRFEESRGEGHRSSESSSRPAPEAARPKGFIAWLKGLFSSKPADPIPSSRSSDRPSGEHHRSSSGGGSGEHDRGPDGHRRRRHRGGRGRHGEHRSDDRGGAPRAEGSSESPSAEGGEQGGHGGHRSEHRGGDGQGHGGHGGRRRHRGGRGRSRGEGGGDRGDRGPRPEGQQGGGYI